MADLLAAIALFLNAELGYPVVDAPLVLRAHTGAAGMYVRGAIVLDEGVDLTTLHGRSVLVHEMAHHAQAQGAVVRYCAEGDAYFVQMRYLWIIADQARIEEMCDAKG